MTGLVSASIVCIGLPWNKSQPADWPTCYSLCHISPPDFFFVCIADTVWAILAHRNRALIWEEVESWLQVCDITSRKVQ